MLRAVHRAIHRRSISLSRTPLAAMTSSAPSAPAAPPAGLAKTCWGQEQQVQKFPSLTRDEGEVDVVVVGAGLGGLCTAWALATKGKSVAVVEMRTVGAGQTGRTSAHIMQWHDDFYSHLESKWGEQNTRLIAHSMVSAVEWLEHVATTEKIDCDFVRVPGYLIPPDINASKSQVKVLDQELAACHRIGMTDVRKVDLGGAGPAKGTVKDALLFPKCADFHPLKFLNGLATVLTKKYGVKLFEGSPVLRKNLTADGKVPAETGGMVTAREAIVLATNSPFTHNVAVHARQEAWRTYMLVCAIPKGAVERAQWWTAEEIYRYIRTQPFDDKTDLILIGGGDHLTGQSASLYTDVWRGLEEYLRSRFPQTQEVLFKWSGQVYEPADELGLYGLDPLNPLNLPGAAGSVAGVASNVVAGAEGAPAPVLPNLASLPALPADRPHVKRYIITGDSGQGMTGSAIAAMVLSDAITGRPNPWSHLYSPSRVNTLLAPSTIHGVGSEALATVSGYAAVVAPRSLSDVKHVVAPEYDLPDLPPGEGAVVQEGAFKVAAYRDPDGTLHKMSALCTHMACLVSWNPNSSTFDCCCHGSQFDAHGKVIQGPACVDLEEIVPGPGKKVPAAPVAQEPAAKPVQLPPKTAAAEPSGAI